MHSKLCALPFKRLMQRNSRWLCRSSLGCPLLCSAAFCFDTTNAIIGEKRDDGAEADQLASSPVADNQSVGFHYLVPGDGLRRANCATSPPLLDIANIRRDNQQLGRIKISGGLSGEPAFHRCHSRTISFSHLHARPSDRVQAETGLPWPSEPESFRPVRLIRLIEVGSPRIYFHQYLR